MLKTNLFIFISVLGISSVSVAVQLPDDSSKKIIAQQDIENYLLAKLPQLKGNLLEDDVYNEFVSNLKFNNPSSLQTIRVLKLAIKELETAYRTEKDIKTQGKILITLDRLTQNGLIYSTTNNNILLHNYLLKIIGFVGNESYSIAKKSDTTKTGYAPDKEKQIEVFLFNLESAITRLHDGVHPDKPTEELKFRNTKLQISFKEVLVENVGNVSFIVPKKIRKKVYTFKITEPTVDSAEAAYLTTKGLLANEYVKGVYLDDRLKIPSKLKANSYELSQLGSNVLLTRPSCTRLFQ